MVREGAGARGVGTRREPTLDGLRGLAVAGVVAFHLDRLDGGYLGVDLFFVLSGYLITSLLLAEHDRSGRIDLRAFWGRRARRLLPAMCVLLAAVAVYAVVAAQSSELARIRDQMLATVTYVANWQQLGSGSGYWDTFATPSPLKHTWSLAIEEQFYLLWPLLVLAVGALRWPGRRPARADEPGRARRRLAVRVLVLSALGSLVGWWLMATLFDPASPERAYLGTDTRAPAVLVGAALAAVLALWRPASGRRGRVVLEGTAVASCAFLAWAWWTWRGGDALQYRGGFALCGLAVVVIVVALVHPRRGPLAHVFSWRPLVGLGLISYGLYLWHWPVIVVLDANRVGLDGWALDAVRIALSLALAVVSYVLVEQPIRHRRWEGRPGGWIGARSVAVVGAAVTVLAIVATAVVTVQAPTDELDLAQISAASQGTLAPQTGDAVGLEQPVDAAAPVPRAVGRPTRVLVVGDSVGSTLAAELAREEGEWGLTVANRGAPTCTLDEGPGVIHDKTGKEVQQVAACQEWATRWPPELATFKPDLVVMAFGGIEQGDRLIDGRFVKPCEPAYGDWYERQLERAVDVLSSYGAIVAVTTFAYSDHSLYGPDAVAAADCMNAAVARGVARRPATARLVPLGSWLCPGGLDRCQRDVPGTDRPIRIDGLHYGSDGARLAWAWILPQVLAAPAPAPTGGPPPAG